MKINHHIISNSNPGKYQNLIFILFYILSFVLMISCSSARMYRAEKTAEASGADYDSPAEEKTVAEEDEAGEVSGSVMAGKKSKPSKKRMIIYESELRLEVESIQNSIARTKSLLQEYKGIVEEIETRNSGKEAHLKLRVPVHKFDEALSELEKLGNLLSRSISADDVTDAFTDTKLRLETLKKIRTRLYSLLKLEKKAEEKVKILKEIQRLTTEIELMLTNLEYYKNKSSYSTIQLHLQALAHKTETVYIPSPFSWINNLSPSSISTRYKGFLFDSFKLHKPEDFFDRLSDYKDHKGNYIFTTPGYTSGLRVGYTRNYPKANREFWKQALLLDAKNRYYKVVEETKVSGNYEFISFETSKQEIYSIAFQVREKEIIICEGYFKDKDIYKQYKPSFVSFIEKLEVLR